MQRYNDDVQNDTQVFDACLTLTRGIMHVIITSSHNTRLSTTGLKRVNFDSSIYIEYKLILIQLFHYTGEGGGA